MILTQNKHKALICGGMITLERYHMGPNPDEVGTLEQWEAVLWPMFWSIPFVDLWKGLRVRAIHMDCPFIEDETKAGIANLQDFDTTSGGFQVAAGLYWSKDKLDIGFFPRGWKPEDAPQVRPIHPDDVLNALNVLAHEAGHFNADLSGYGKTSTLIQRELTKLFDSLTAGLAGQASNQHELWAEVHRAFFGPPGARGFFSDNKPYTDAHNRKAYTLMLTAYWLNGWLSNVEFDQLQAWDDRIIWLQYKRVFGFKVADAWYSVDRNWRRSKWDGQTWQPA